MGAVKPPPANKEHSDFSEHHGYHPILPFKAWFVMQLGL